MKKLNKEEKLDLINTFKKVINAKDDGTDREFTKGGWIKYFMKKDYLLFDNGEFVEFDKLSIENNLYYDDEQPDPEDLYGKHDAFIKYNMFYSYSDNGFDKWIEAKRELEETGCCVGDILDKPMIYEYTCNDGEKRYDVGYFHPYSRYDNSDSKRELTDNEINGLIEYMREYKAAYIKRLETYFKRYKDKIWSVGYWANR